MTKSLHEIMAETAPDGAPFTERDVLDMLRKVREATLEDAAMVIDNTPSRALYMHYDAMAYAIRQLKTEKE